jgi:HAD superfamily hydrolase (TIGR01509 family)
MLPAPEYVEAVIFDLDGTLVDSEELGLAVLHRHATTLGVTLPPGQEIATLRGRSMASTLALFAQQLGRPLPDDFEATVRADMAEVFRQQLQPMPGALELLQSLRIPCCIATNGPRHKAELTLGLTGLLPWFEGRLFSAYELGVFKPDPGLFLAAAAALGVEPAHCAVVEDSLPGLHAGIAAGMHVYAVNARQDLPLDLRDRVHVRGGLRELLDEAWHATLPPPPDN